MLRRASCSASAAGLRGSASRVSKPEVLRPLLLGPGQLRRFSQQTDNKYDDVVKSVVSDPAFKKEVYEELTDHNQPHRDQVHFKLSVNRHPLNIQKLDPKEKLWEHPLQHSVWSHEEVEGVRVTHYEPKDLSDRAAYRMAQVMRFFFDAAAGFHTRRATEEMYLNRIIYLETVAAIPGMAAGMIRHLHSLRKLQRDHGWIHTLLEEAENERMHLLTFLKLKQPGALFRASVLLTQGVFFNVFFLSYLIQPRVCHRLVGYMEEEAIKTYTHVIEELDAGNLPLFEELKPPAIATAYWKLAPDATFRDLLLVIRADEDHHRLVNHTFAEIKQDDDNPFIVSKQVAEKIKVVDPKASKPKPVAGKK